MRSSTSSAPTSARRVTYCPHLERGNVSRALSQCRHRSARTTDRAVSSLPRDCGATMKSIERIAPIDRIRARSFARVPEGRSALSMRPSRRTSGSNASGFTLSYGQPFASCHATIAALQSSHVPLPLTGFVAHTPHRPAAFAARCLRFFRVRSSWRGWASGAFAVTPRQGCRSSRAGTLTRDCANSRTIGICSGRPIPRTLIPMTLPAASRSHATLSVSFRLTVSTNGPGAYSTYAARTERSMFTLSAASFRYP
jgi:hypothetical protein